MIMYIYMDKIQAYILLIDFEKAFDSIEWPYMFRCMKTYNFGECLIKLIKTLYKNIQSVVSNKVSNKGRSTAQTNKI